MLTSIDIETDSNLSFRPDPYKDKILITAVGFDDGRREVVLGEGYPIWLLELITDPNVKKVIHNASFEGKFWQHKFGVKARNVWDTLAQERLLTAGKDIGGNDLPSVANRRLGIFLDKSFLNGLAIRGTCQEAVDGCLKDMSVLLPIFKQQKREIISKGQQNASRLENDASLIVADMELHGIGFDGDLWSEYLVLMGEEKAKAVRHVWDLLGVPYQENLFGGVSGGLPLGSRDKVLLALAQVGIKLEDYRSETLLDYYLRHQDCLLIRALLDYKKLEKAISWDYPKHINPVTSRIQPDWNPQGADTFRWTSSHPNMQQVAQPFSEKINFRHLFRARPGYKFVGSDFNQIELRLLIELSEEPKYIQALNAGVDLHSLTGQIVCGKPVKKGDLERRIGKIINFGVLAYKGSYLVLISTAMDAGVLIPVRDARSYVKVIRAENPMIEAWGRRQLQKMLEDGFIDTPVGHRRYLPGVDRETVARNTTIQMYAAGILKEAMSKVFFDLQSFEDAHIVLQVHDELVLEVKEEDAERAKEMLVSRMLEAERKYLIKVPSGVEAYISNTWEK